METYEFNSSYQYSFNDDRGGEIAVAADLILLIKCSWRSVIYNDSSRAPIMALTGYVRQHFKGLDLKATYTLDSYSYNNIGLELP
jgi:hypothetical protein